MSAEQNTPGQGQSPARALPVSSPDVPEDMPWDECMDDVILPPGGTSRRMLIGRNIVAAGRMGAVDYLTKQGRDLRLDLLRGYFVVAMIIDHVRGPSPLYLLTGGNRFYTSAAEGFILTSGFVAGLVYRRLLERDLANSLQRLLERALSLFLLTLGVTLAFLPLSEILELPWAQGIDLTKPIDLLVSIATLHRTYYLIDVMLLYAILFLLAPLAFILLVRGHAWPVLAASWLLWALYQFYPQYADLPWPIAGNYLFNFSAWQVLFFTGLVLGYRHDRLPALGGRGIRLAVVVTGVLTAALIAVYFIVDPPTAAMPGQIAITSPVFHQIRIWLQDYVFAKVDLRPGRLAASAITFSFLFFALTLLWSRVRRLLGWLLLPLGQHALYAYTAHIVIVGFVAILLAPFKLTYPGPQWLNAAIQIASVLLIWLLVRLQFLAPSARSERLWHASPAAIAVVALLVMLWAPLPNRALPDEQAVAMAGVQERVPRRFGTPIPRESLKPPAPSAPITTTAEAQPTIPSGTPTPSPLQRELDLRLAEVRLSPYASGIKGQIIERWFYSAELDRDMPYVIYLPPDYDHAGRRYPVLYMLHGRGGHRDEWLAYGLLDVADREIRTGNLDPLIIVLPQGDTWFWANHTGDGPRWGEYLARDLIAHIDVMYLTLRKPTARAIGGLSMGGWGALYHAFRSPNIFGVVGAHSPSLYADDGSLPFLGVGREFDGKDPVELVGTVPGLEALQIWIDTAEADPWLDRVRELHDNLVTVNVPHIFQVFPGVHEFSYWEQHTLDYLRYYGKALARQ